MITIETQKFPNLQDSLIAQVTEFLNQKTQQYQDFYYLQNRRVDLINGDILETKIFHLPDPKIFHLPDLNSQLLDSLVDLINHIIWETQVYLVPGNPFHYCFQKGNISNYELHASYNYLTIIYYYSGQQ